MNENVLLCEFYPHAKNSGDIKIEIGTIMASLCGLFKNDPYEGISFKSYAVKAFDENDKEILYAISSVDTASLIGRGQSVEWLKLPYFQENTDSYRLNRAKTIISEIENGLRLLIKIILKDKFGEEWWNLAIGDKKIGGSVEKTYNEQFGIEESNGDVLINYTFTIYN
ncbi:hypothetical protein [Olivibacter sp. XZL3]|uniref:hypothetical protein n=1 Tax=Olivibacter sp. XZL3 TaxID=1735116 RepID=UPI001066A2BB|nr:hypothetical protein [Olivibacter sp. XZL3]